MAGARAGTAADHAGPVAHRHRDPRRRTDHGRRRGGSRAGARVAHRRGDAGRSRNRARYRNDADRRQQPCGRAGRGRTSGHRQRNPARRCARGTGLRPHGARRQGHRHRAEEPRRGRAAGGRGAVPAVGQSACGAVDGDGDSAGDADDDQRHGREWRLRQSDEPGRAGFRPDRGRCRDHRRELFAASVRILTPWRRGKARRPAAHGLPRHRRGDPPQPVRRVHHHRRLSADLHAGRRGGPHVSPHGADRGDGPGRGLAALGQLRAGWRGPAVSRAGS